MTWKNSFMDTTGINGMSPSGYQSMMGYGQPSSSLFGIGDGGFSGYAPVADNSASVVSPSIWDNFTQQKLANGMTTGGWGSTGLGILQGLGSAYMGWKQLGLAEDALKSNKDQFEKNYAAQKQATNASLEDRQRARVASNPGAYQSVGDYMKKYGVA